MSSSRSPRRSTLGGARTSRRASRPLRSHFRMVAVHRLGADAADAGVAIHAARPWGPVAQLPVEQRIGDEPAPDGDGVTQALLEGGLHSRAGEESTDADDRDGQRLFEVARITEVVDFVRSPDQVEDEREQRPERGEQEAADARQVAHAALHHAARQRPKVPRTTGKPDS